MTFIALGILLLILRDSLNRHCSPIDEIKSIYGTKNKECLVVLNVKALVVTNSVITNRFKCF